MILYKKMTSSISYSKNHFTKKENAIISPLNDITNYLKQNYNKNMKYDLTYFEYFNMKQNDFKVVFDIDKKIMMSEKENFDFKTFLDNIYTGLNEVCNCNNEDWAVSCDNRDIKENDKKMYKLSYHFILINKKTNYETMNKYKSAINKSLKKYNFQIDESIYSNGYQYFRMLYSRKDKKDKKSLLLPLTHKDNFNNHIIQLVEDIEDELDLNCIELDNDEIQEEQTELFNIDDLDDDDDEIFKPSKKQLESIKDYELNTIKKDKKFWRINLKNHPCKWGDHTNNNRYLLLSSNYVKLKCYSDDCKGEEEIIWEDYSKTLNLTPTDDNLASLFKLFYEDNFVYVYEDDKGKRGDFYFFNGKYWVFDKNNKNISDYIANQFYFKLDDIINEKMREADDREKLLKLKEKMASLQNTTKIDKLIRRLQSKLVKEIEFNTNPYYLVFNNGVYDLKNFVFLKKTRPDEYVNNFYKTGYDYKPLNKKLLEEFKTDYINKVFINKDDDKDVFFKLFSTSLLGKRYKKYIIANGSGNNAKSNIMSLCVSMLGNYAYKINVKDLCVGKKDCFELNNLHNKRFVYCEEPDSDTMKFDGNTIKDLTGNDTTNFRKMYSSGQSTINIKMLLIICCNKKPPINCFDDAIKERTMDYPFLSTFTNEDINNTSRFKGNVYYDTKEFRDKYKLCLFHFLIEYLKKFYDDEEQIKLTKNLAKRVEDYLLESDGLYNWFNDTYEIIKDDEFKNRKNVKSMILTMKMIYNEYKDSEYYKTLNRNKRITLKRKLLEELNTRKQIKKYYRKQYQPKDKETGKQIRIRNCFIKLRERETPLSKCDLNDDYDD